jgi:nitroreductase
VNSDSAAARIAFLRGLRALRQLRPDPLPEAVVHDILEVARWSGSAGNRQPWEFVVVRDRDMLQRLSAIEGATAGHLASAALGLAIRDSARGPRTGRL